MSLSIEGDVEGHAGSTSRSVLTGLTTASGQSLYNSRNAAHLDGQAQDKARRIEVRKYRGKLREGRNRDLLLAANRRPIIMISTFSRRRSQDHWKETKFVLIDIDKLRG
ncbi:hypothetical protein K503DRAFT_360371 [Rhizopogon vinicolor AM-OR11-026]|uniref:Uncharacterized protein n=1 Tax=Rhizopogon vinicolor AM-OR11-026 TaxID=1314800 RepID=A0A1B7MSF7_9AGAM|nr:hypothetical protein K503DRAFT_360371 [Rhizopogon vinicolor AM-OR11-026]